MGLASHGGAEEFAALGRTLLATVLLVGGVAKLRDLGSFRAVLQALAPRMRDPWIAGFATVVVSAGILPRSPWAGWISLGTPDCLSFRSG